MKILNPKPREKIEAVIFDLDATLLDTEENWFLSDKRLLSDYGIHFTKKMKEKYIGKSLESMVNDLKIQHNLNVSFEELRVKKNQYYLEIAKGNTFIFPKMKLFYDKIKSAGYPFCIASGTDYHVIEILLKELDIFNDFQFIITAEQVKNGKPAPDIFLESANRLQINPVNILVLEDSIYGIEAAINAGMNTIAIPYLPVNRDQQDNMNPEIRSENEIFNQADILFEKGMNEFDYRIVFDWMNLN